MGLCTNSSLTVYSLQQHLIIGIWPNHNIVTSFDKQHLKHLIFTHPRAEQKYNISYIKYEKQVVKKKDLSVNIGTSEPAFNSLCRNTRPCLDTSLKALSLYIRQAHVYYKHKGCQKTCLGFCKLVLCIE